MGQASSIMKNLQGNWCKFALLSVLLTTLTVLHHQVDSFPNIIQVIFSRWLLRSKYGWQWRTLRTPGRKSTCAGLCDFRSEACSARVSGQIRAIFRQKLRCAGCLVKLGEFLLENKKKVSGKTQAILGEKLINAQVSGKIRRESVRKSNMQISGQTRVASVRK